MTNEKLWIDIIPVDELEIDWVTSVTLGERQLAVYDAKDGIYVSLSRCSHAGADLCDGYFDGNTIECPLHQGYFDVRNGRALGAPATKSLRTYEARVVKGIVQILI